MYIVWLCLQLFLVKNNTGYFDLICYCKRCCFYFILSTIVESIIVFITLIFVVFDLSQFATPPCFFYVSFISLVVLNSY